MGDPLKDFLTTEDTEDTPAFVLFFSVCPCTRSGHEGFGVIPRLLWLVFFLRTVLRI